MSDYRSPKKQSLTLHWLIARQLRRTDISEADISSNKKQAWQDFIKRINRIFYDHEQEKYLLERSMNISSKEMLELNQKLEDAQKIAHLGYWFYDRKENKLMWSDETFYLAGIDPTEGTPTFEEVMELVHKDDRKKLITLINAAFSEGKDYELEIRFKNKAEGIYYWHYTKGHPHVELGENMQDQGIRYLSGIIMDITKRKNAEEEMKNMHQQLLAISRQAGMAEVATSVLHNIGNVLNSANVSLAFIIEILKQSHYPHIEKLIKISNIVKEHLVKNDEYLTKDKVGKLVPKYLSLLSQDILKDNKDIAAELNNIDVHLSHIKDIVILQQDISGIAGIKENIILTELLDLAIKMGCSSAESKGIEVIKNYQYNDFILSEKAKLLQIVVNLIRNARDSVLACNNNKKRIIISTKKCETTETVEIKVTDNGSGILNENLTRIFSLGFTTKPNGHGFGLHSSAIAATELGGTLKAESSGTGRGATFIFELPLTTQNLPEKELSS